MDKGYESRLRATRWEEGMLCGNGTIGALVMGEPLHERVIFTHERLFAPLHKPRLPVHTAKTLGQIRALLAEGKYQEAADFVVQQGFDEGYKSTMYWTDPFMAACTLAVNLEAEGEPEDYRKSLNFENGLSTTAFMLDGGQVMREVFVSRPDRIAVMRLRAERPVNVLVRLHKLIETDEPNMWWEIGYTQNHAEPVVAVKGDTIFYDGRFQTVDYGYRCAAKVAKTDGVMKQAAEGIRITGLTEAVLYFNVVTCENMKEPEVCAASAFAGLEPDFDELLSRHAEVHGTVYNRIELDLDDPESDEQLAEELWARSRNEGTPPPNGFFKRIFDAGRYEILCSSGETPPNLQGIWTGTDHVYWSADYTQNGNIQTAVLAALPGNMFEAMDSFINFEEELVPDNRVNAERLYGCRGQMLAARGGKHGLLNHFGPRWCMTFWTAGAAWNAHFFYDYYLYSGDRDFFVNHALPYMKECALFYEDFLIEDENGRWLFSPSYSPENNPEGSEAQACINATMDIAVATELFSNLIEGCKTLGLEAESIPKWQRMLDKMPPYLINEDGALKEWATPLLKDRYDHRHSSHLYMLYYSIPKEIRENQALYDACEKAYEYRMKFKEKEKGEMAFGNIQMAFAAAHLRDSATVWKLMCVMAQNNYFNIFASSHDMGPSIFNADISGGFPALMLEALVESRQVTDESGKIVSYEIELLPNLPKAWPKGRLKGVRARGGFELDFAWDDGKVTECHVINHCGSDYTMIGADVK